MTPAHRTDFSLRTELGGSRSKEKTPCGRLKPRSWTSRRATFTTARRGTAPESTACGEESWLRVSSRGHPAPCSAIRFQALLVGTLGRGCAGTTVIQRDDGPSDAVQQPSAATPATSSRDVTPQHVCRPRQQPLEDGRRCAGSQRVRGSNPLSSPGPTWPHATVLCLDGRLWSECALILALRRCIPCAVAPVRLMTGCGRTRPGRRRLGSNNDVRRVLGGWPGGVGLCPVGLNGRHRNGQRYGGRRNPRPVMRSEGRAGGLVGQAGQRRGDRGGDAAVLSRSSPQLQRPGSICVRRRGASKSTVRSTTYSPLVSCSAIWIRIWIGAQATSIPSASRNAS